MPEIGRFRTNTRVAAVVCVMAGVAIAGYGLNGRTGTDAAIVDADSAAGLLAEPPAADFGVATPGRTQAVRVRLMNASNKPVRVTEVRPSCGCITAELADAGPVRPGMSVELTLTLRTDETSSRSPTRTLVTVATDAGDRLVLPVTAAAAETPPSPGRIDFGEVPASGPVTPRPLTKPRHLESVRTEYRVLRGSAAVRLTENVADSGSAGTQGPLVGVAGGGTGGSASVTLSDDRPAGEFYAVIECVSDDSPVASRTLVRGATEGAVVSVPGLLVFSVDFREGRDTRVLDVRYRPRTTAVDETDLRLLAVRIDGPPQVSAAASGANAVEIAFDPAGLPDTFSEIFAEVVVDAEVRGTPVTVSTPVLVRVRGGRAEQSPPADPLADAVSAWTRLNSDGGSEADYDGVIRRLMEHDLIESVEGTRLAAASRTPADLPTLSFRQRADLEEEAVNLNDVLKQVTVTLLREAKARPEVSEDRLEQVERLRDWTASENRIASVRSFAKTLDWVRSAIGPK